MPGLCQPSAAGDGTSLATAEGPRHAHTAMRSIAGNSRVAAVVGSLSTPRPTSCNVEDVALKRARPVGHDHDGQCPGGMQCRGVHECLGRASGEATILGTGFLLTAACLEA